ncbi:YbaK/EbsC family protein [Pelosinus sp. UFO1]|uniref:YbaK/EbsC family protein n=1 Tax=Pelosinus sp. UFO1 TaxID=484770 RepID=UPI0004D15907|nr:YbaK/EbsC family protein [Pelosinus sp. UFO1]AIF54133.1 YbaK/prolyl-tRNA synthetase associated region [Pelosinus sp. UFO1]
MSFEKVKKYFDGVGLGQRVVEREQIGATVEQAAVSIGCEPARIAKTMSVFLDEKAALIVMAGDAKIDNAKYKACLQQKAKMIPGELVETYIGHFPGAVCPFAVKVGVRVFLDVSLKRFDIIYTAGGSLNSTVKLSLEELETHSASAGWIDVCKGWFVN